MRKLDLIAATLVLVGGLNWGLVGIAKFDLVAWICGGLEFGETNAVSRIVYSLVGLAAVYGIASLLAAAPAPHDAPPPADGGQPLMRSSDRKEPRMKKLVSLLVVVAALVASTAATAPAQPSQSRDIVKTAAAAGQFKTLARAVDPGGSRRRAGEARPVHRLRPDRRGIRQGAEEDARQPARRQGEAEGRPPLPRRPRQGHGGRRHEAHLRGTLNGKSVRIRSPA